MSIPNRTSALDLIIWDVEEFVGPFRRLYCPSGKGGMPSHVTLLYPFKPSTEVTDALLDDVAGYFAEIRPMSLRLEKIQFFERAAFLLPEPVELFSAVIEGLMRKFPECKPYGADFEKPPLPHLTFAQSGNADELREVAERFRQKSVGRLPVDLRVDAAYLTFVEKGVSTPAYRFGLGEKKWERV